MLEKKSPKLHTKAKIYVVTMTILFALVMTAYFIMNSSVVFHWNTIIVMSLLGIVSDLLSRKESSKIGNDDLQIDFAGAFAVTGILISGTESGMMIAFIVSWITCIGPRFQIYRKDKTLMLKQVLLGLYDVIEYPFFLFLIGITLERVIITNMTLWIWIPIALFIYDQLNMILTAISHIIIHDKKMKMLPDLFTVDFYRTNFLYFLYLIFTPVIAYYLYFSIGYVGVVLAACVIIPGTYSGHLLIQLRMSQKMMELDNLTGIRNLIGFQYALNTQKGSDTKFAVIMMDLDRFKLVNDTMGHDAGDRVLLTFSTKMRSLLERYGTCCELFRLHGDEFAIFVKDITVVDDLSLVLSKNANLFTYSEDGRSFDVCFSAGIQIGNPGDTISDVIELADKALYVAKNAGKAQMRSICN